MSARFHGLQAKALRGSGILVAVHIHLLGPTFNLPTPLDVLDRIHAASSTRRHTLHLSQRAFAHRCPSRAMRDIWPDALGSPPGRAWLD